MSKVFGLRYKNEKYIMVDDIFKYAPSYTQAYKNSKDFVKKKNITDFLYFKKDQHQNKWFISDGKSNKYDKIFIPENSVKFDIELISLNHHLNQISKLKEIINNLILENKDLIIQQKNANINNHELNNILTKLEYENQFYNTMNIVNQTNTIMSDSISVSDNITISDSISISDNTYSMDNSDNSDTFSYVPYNDNIFRQISQIN